MVRKVWVCFDEEYEQLEVCTDEDRKTCLYKDCEPYVMKLIPVNKDASELNRAVSEFERTAKDFDEVTKGFKTSSRRLKRSLDRYKI
jgi:hypothetical protein